MKTKFILFIAALAGVVAIVVWRESRFARQAMQTRAALSFGDAKIVAALCDAEARLTTAEKERTDLQSTLDSSAKARVSKPAAPAKKADSDAATAMAEWAKAEEARQRDPQVQLRQLAAGRTKLVARYGALYWKLHLLPEQIDQLETIVARRDEQYGDLWEAVVAQGVTAGDADFVKLYSPLRIRIDDAYHTATKELLGDAGYQQFTDYERGLSARTIVQGVAGAAVLAGTPFSSQQAEQLVDIVANASGNYRKGGEVTSLDIDWAQADGHAREILSSEQMTAFQTLEASTANTGRLRSQFSRAMNEAEKADRKQAVASKPAGE